MSNEELVSRTAAFVKDKFKDESSGHDWWHIYRVWQLAKRIAAKEKGANILVVELGALLHDIADFKFHGNDLEAGPKAARVWLAKAGADDQVILAVEDIVRNVSFKGAKIENKFKSIDGQIVHDADKLDAIGAIGIARVFAYSGFNGNLIHDPDRKVLDFKTFEEYANYKSTSINHFYEKLLLLKDRMLTKTGNQMAARRHEYMENYLKEFYTEWDGKL